MNKYAQRSCLCFGLTRALTRLAHSFQTSKAESDISAVYAVLMNNGFAAADITVVQCDESVAAAFDMTPNYERGLRITCEGKTIAVVRILLSACALCLRLQTASLR